MMPQLAADKRTARRRSILRAMPSDCPTPEVARRVGLERALKLLRTGKDPVRILEELSRRLTNKLLHTPTKAVFELAGIQAQGADPWPEEPAR
jgi:glutamyl-tRNA reductase